MKNFLFLLFFFLIFQCKVKSQTAHPPQNHGADGMYYWNESLQKYTPANQAQIDYRKYYSMFNGNQSVIDYLTGKVFMKKSNGSNEFVKIQFIGMDAISNKPFDYNPYPNATDYSGAPWHFPQNRFRMLLSTENNQVDTFFIWQVVFQANGAARLTFYRNGSKEFVGAHYQDNIVPIEESIGNYWYLFKQDPTLNRGIESYLSDLPNGMFRIEDNFYYNVNENTNSKTNSLNSTPEKKETKLMKFLKVSKEVLNNVQINVNK
jgi:hypothetical protein